MNAKDIRGMYDKEQLDMVIQALEACATPGKGCKECPYNVTERANCLKMLLEDTAYQLKTMNFLLNAKGGK